MSRRCQLTGKSNNFGNTVSHSNRRLRHMQKANVVRKRLYIPSKKRWIQLKVSTAALRTIEKVGVEEFLRREGFRL